jgi:hypothetical protein
VNVQACQRSHHSIFLLAIPSRINTSKSVSKQTTLTFFRINTYEKHRGEGVLLLTRCLFPSTFTNHGPVSPLFATHTNPPSRKSFTCHSYENTGGVLGFFPFRNFALALESLLPLSRAPLARSFPSFRKECLRAPLQPTRSALFPKTAGCVAHRGIDPVFPFYSPCAILPPGSSEGRNHHETSSLLRHPMENCPGITTS